MIANVHFEPGSSLRNIRERFRAIHENSPSYQAGLFILIGDFNICEPENGRFNVITQTFSDRDPGRAAAFRSFSPHASDKAQPGFKRKEAAPDGALRI